MISNLKIKQHKQKVNWVYLNTKIQFRLLDIIFKFKNLFFINKKQSIKTGGFFILFFLFNTISLCSSATLPTNISQSIGKIILQYELQTQKKPNMVIYYKNLSSYNFMYYQNINILNDARSQYVKLPIFNVYSAEWQQKYSPGVIKYDESLTNVSFLALPRSNFFSDKFLYDFKFIVIDKYTVLSPNDIYITDTYANKILIARGYSGNEYEKLLLPNESLINIPYRTCSLDSYRNIHENIYADNFYNIKGIINTNNKEYTKYKKIFGEFFIVNDFLTLPIPFQTYFELSDSDEGNQILIKTLLQNCKVDMNLKVNSTVISNPIQCRLALFGNLEDELNITNVAMDQTSNIYNQRMLQIFDLDRGRIHNQKELYIMFNVINCVGLLLYIIVIIKDRIKFIYMHLETLSIIFINFIVLITLILLLYLSAILTFGIVFMCAPYLNGINYLTFELLLLFNIFLVTILFLFMLIYRRKARRDLSGVDNI